MDEKQKENLPDRVIAEKNSPYRAAERLSQQTGQQGGSQGHSDEMSAREKMGGHDDQSDHDSESISGREKMRQLNNKQSQGLKQGQGQNQRQAGGQGQSSQNEQTYQDKLDPGFQKENQLPGTVSLDTDPYDGPSKLDNVDAPSHRGPENPQRGYTN